jgi:CubicO group peptidase (beta-lactamase class C family)
MKNKVPFLLPFLAFFIISCIRYSGDNEVSSSSVNMSAEKLNIIDTLLLESIEKEWIRGAVAYISCDEKIAYYRAFGTDDTENNKSLRKDAIFRIASQTKAITSVAVMILFEEGKFLLDDPVSIYIPEFKNPVVLDKYNEKDTTYTTIPANREITIRDLLTHTSGIDYADIGSQQMTAIYQKAGIPAGFVREPFVLADKMKKLAALPLIHQPGERFTYGLNTDVLGYLVEVVSGMSVDMFMKSRIFEPLGMKDTYFYLPEEKYERLVSVHSETENGLVQWKETTFRGISANYPIQNGTYFSGGAGLSSTITDYAAFLQMLLNGGELNGNRVLAKRTVELMISNQIGNLNLGKNKFGLGFEITTKEGEAISGVSEGSFAWGGFFGTTYWADPEENMVCLLFCQQWPLSHGEISDKFRVLVYSAIDD